jgi:hypothetical protein
MAAHMSMPASAIFIAGLSATTKEAVRDSQRKLQHAPVDQEFKLNCAQSHVKKKVGDKLGKRTGKRSKNIEAATNHSERD